ncbi:uncharacterized protein PHALS_04896 [Plasmopara halstedii]|uniref:Uncharacterized protein n=1 Tax=Plasmopara halstedii TaxID=4781 RepID=A0A0P1AZ49_PLAHL|nr:uncharacterized protein PHALS_04896 [Plasmopara halstedii]CEG47750.1 hypothetical protein PHALS_04896 [Plasmopara halstedii]|eukprot:XP_024584119.1 hypothetical protein PHALS_04896 [Plasmopara halstedii]
MISWLVVPETKAAVRNTNKTGMEPIDYISDKIVQFYMTKRTNLKILMYLLKIFGIIVWTLLSIVEVESTAPILKACDIGCVERSPSSEF